MKVKRVVDTVTIEMDISVAEKLAEMVSHYRDNTGRPYQDDASELLYQLISNGEVRYPSPLFKTEPYGHPANLILALEWK